MLSFSALSLVVIHHTLEDDQRNRSKLVVRPGGFGYRTQQRWGFDCSGSGPGAATAPLLEAFGQAAADPLAL